MSATTSIEWCDSTWNPTRGCSRVSEGCRHCYAERMASRFSDPGQPYHGFATRTPSGPRWTGKVELVPGMLGLPLRWRKPRRIFVNSMSDLFHEDLSNDEIAAVFGIMAACPQHTFLVLTKRARRMQDWFARDVDHATDCGEAASRAIGEGGWSSYSPELLSTPAAVRFVSYEPALGPVDFAGLMGAHEDGSPPAYIDQIIVGGESGPRARPFDLAWARSVISQCRATGCKVFVKQLGARPYSLAGDSLCPDGSVPVGCFLGQRDSKGGDPSEWPEDLRVREFPR